MRRAQTFAALGAVVLAAGALLPLRPSLRVACAALAAALIVALFMFRLRTHVTERRVQRAGDAYARAEKIRAERAKRFRR